METQHALLIAAYRTALLEAHIALELLALTDVPIALVLHEHLQVDASIVEEFAADLGHPQGRDYIRSHRAPTPPALHSLAK
jgi:hypothetical protein